MIRNIAAVCAALLLAGAGGVPGQTVARPGQAPPGGGPGEVRGSVVDAETRSPLPGASVAVWSAADATLVAGAIARQDGTFRIEGLAPGRYTLKIASLGYRTHESAEVEIAPGSPRLVVGSIALARAPIALESLEADADRAVVIAPDRNSYRVRDVAPAATSASEILESVPSVEVDAEGKVSLRGNENVVVQINGRPSPIRGSQLAGYLKQLPANTIERIEVIPNPTAKQDPEGMAGILNIVTKQTVDLGRSVGITLGASTADRYTGSANLGYQGGPLTLMMSYGYNSDERHSVGVNNRTRLDAGAPRSYTEQDIDGTAGHRGHNLNTTIDYKIGRRDAVFTNLMVNRRLRSDASLAGYLELDESRTLVDRYLRVRDVDNGSWLVDGTFGYRRIVTPQRHELSAEVRYNRSQDEDRDRVWRELIGTDGTGDGSTLDVETNALDAVTHQLIVQTDHTRMLGERTKLEAGYKGSSRWLDRDLLVRLDADGTGEWVESDLSNSFQFDERVDALYGVLSQSRGPLELQAGLRAEHASREFSLADGEDFPHSYNSLFPSGLASYKLSDKTQVKLSYSRRIRRPGTFELSPFPTFMDVQNVFLGNPQLDPEYTDAIELSLQRSGQLGSLQVTPFYRHTSDIIRVSVNTADTVAGREVTSVSFRNLATGTSWGADLNGQLRLAKKFSGLASLNIFRMVTDGGGTSTLSSDAISWTARVNGTYNLDEATSVQATYFYRAPTNFERGRFFSNSMANLTLRRKLDNDRATVTLRWSDPFRTSRFRVEAGDDNIVQLTSSQFNSRAVHLTFQYNLGQAPRVRQPRQEPEAPAQTGFPPS
ncbi:MAG TPA: TonB-dependent receptor [Longimicrobiales bacterium]|nr:TonB-dependent receptor [Longimicrobiales bacterium]